FVLPLSPSFFRDIIENTFT
ncbi:hypothetical protein VCHENC02_0104B, partial [Vibrio harveyi]